MMRTLPRRSAACLPIGLLACLITASAHGQAVPSLAPTNRLDTVAVRPPPAGFDPMTASDADLARYGFPPRPDMLRAPDAYAAWRDGMLHARHRVPAILQQTNVRHPASSYSNNWSGDVLTGIATRYTLVSFKTVYAAFHVPTVSAPPAGCAAQRLYSSEWAGLDGWGSNDVVQAGAEADGTCIFGSFRGIYRLWYEWYPNYSITITSISPRAGDTILVAVQVLSPTLAAFFVEDSSTGQYVSLESAAPAGVQFIGNSAEWITERPEVNGHLTTLANYGVVTFTGAATAIGNGITSTPGNPAWLQASTLLTMVDSNQYPISLANLASASSVVTTVTGSAE